MKARHSQSSKCTLIDQINCKAVNVIDFIACTLQQQYEEVGTYLCLGFRAYMVWSYMALSFFSPIQLRMLIGNSWNKMWTKRVLYFMSTGRPLSDT